MSNKLLKSIISVKNKNGHKVLTLFGIKFKFKLNWENIEELKTDVVELKEALADNNLKIDKLQSVIIEIDKRTEYHLTSFEHKRWLNPKDYWWEKENFDFFKDFENLEKKYKKLITGLDDESIDVITRIISRIQTFVLTGRSWFILTEQEIKEKEEFDRFKDEKIQLSDNNYIRKGYILPQEEMEISVLEHKHGLKYIKHFEKFQNKDIIDAGAYIGDSALVLSELTNGKVHSFEPSQENYEKLIKTISLNNKTNIIANKLALGSQEHDDVMKSNTLGAAIESVSNYVLPDCPSENVHVITLDDYVSKNNLQIGLIKVDVEGFEQEFLKGAINTIKSQKPTLIISLYHNVRDMFDIKPIIENLNLGYKFKIYKPFDYTIISELVLICEIEEEKNNG